MSQPDQPYGAPAGAPYGAPPAAPAPFGAPPAAPYAGTPAGAPAPTPFPGFPPPAGPPASGSFGVSIGLALVGALVAAILWALLVYVSERDFVYAAIGVGALCALGARTGNSRNPALPFVVAAITAGGYFLGHCLAVAGLATKLGDVGFGEAFKLVVQHAGTFFDGQSLLFGAVAVAAGFFITFQHLKEA